MEALHCVIFSHKQHVYDFAESLRFKLDRVFAQDTKAPGSPAEPPSAGHCAAVAVLFHRLTGAEFVSAKVNGVSHWFNRILVYPNATEGARHLDVDMTADQFGLPFVRVGEEGSLYPETRLRNAAAELRDETLARSETLLRRLLDLDAATNCDDCA